MQLKTVRLRVADLGFATGALTREIMGSVEDRDLFGHPAPFTGGRCTQLGLDLCPPKLGPELRLQYSEQPVGERIYIAMKPITASDGEPRIFVVEHNSHGMSLDAVRARPGHEWPPDAIFVFCAREVSVAEKTRD
ncbi:MAG: hypothetical protein WA705_21310 [Candidatus Ozemobacteraceae bacterium]